MTNILVTSVVEFNSQLNIRLNFVHKLISDLIASPGCYHKYLKTTNVTLGRKNYTPVHQESV